MLTTGYFYIDFNHKLIYNISKRNNKEEAMNELKTCRMKHKYTCKIMAEKLGVSKPFYWQIENNKRRLSYEMAIKIANIFGLKPDDIFYDELKNKVK